MEHRHCLPRAYLCPGLLVGFRTADYAVRLLELDLHADGELGCICESDTCSADTIQVVPGCSTGGGSIFSTLPASRHLLFFDRRTDRSVRLVLRPSASETREVKKAVLNLPVIHRILSRAVCSVCGEETDQEMLCLRNGRLICRDCSERLDRFHI